jgi:hypothetical protein
MLQMELWLQLTRGMLPLRKEWGLLMGEALG